MVTTKPTGGKPLSHPTHKKVAELPPGFSVIHSNRMEDLRRLAIQWVRRHPLAPLENEVFIVQSNGMAQWLKLALAETNGCGISAAVSFQLPARFLWQAYGAVLGQEEIPSNSPYDKAPLKWRLLRLLKRLSHKKRFSAISRFLSHDPDSIKRYQLACRLADLYDQYQVYRADWLEDWTNSRDQLRNAHGKPAPLPFEQHWQAELWRLIQSDMPYPVRHTDRSSLHRRFLKAARTLSERDHTLPRRIIIFGVSTLPGQALEALHALSGHCQVLFFVHNPCRFYWADILEDRELLKFEQVRHFTHTGDPNKTHPESLQHTVNPLLASWGKQGRDYIGLLYGYDRPEAYRKRFEEIDLFDDFAPKDKDAPLLSRVQQAILDLTPLPGTHEKKSTISPIDRSITFIMAYSRQREVEILQDQLLELFKGSPNLKPKDIIVMAPDIDVYTPHIESVFGNLSRQDPRFVPFAIADGPDRAGLPMLRALEKLLHLPTLRLTQSDILDLLQVPAFRHRFGLGENDLQKLQIWIDGAGIRWGLDATQRTAFDLPRDIDENTWASGFRRMLLGYAVGTGESWRDIEPYGEIGGLEAELIGPLHLIINQLEKHWQALKSPGLPEVWYDRILTLINDFFLPTDSNDLLIRRLLEDITSSWRKDCMDAGLEEPLSVAVVRDALLGALKDQNMSQRFLVGMVNFCTLMPMRAIPFKMVCLLGMNDGEYPRSAPPKDFDLMAAPGLFRPGDRSRREDDRYLFLEALLSARETLRISYIARNVNDNSARMPSVLVSQLRDYLAGGWQIETTPWNQEETDSTPDLLDHLTCLHPLQPFSKAYFLSPGSRDLFTHAGEWRRMLDPRETRSDQDRLGPAQIHTGPGLSQLIRCLKNPVKCFFNERLNVYFDDTGTITQNRESFTLDGLSPFNQGKMLLNAGLAVPDSEGTEGVYKAVHRAAQRLQHTGELPPGGFGPLSAKALAEPVLQMLEHHQRLARDYPHPCPPVEIRFPIRIDGCNCQVLEDWLDGLRAKKPGQYTRWTFYPKDILDSKNRISRLDSLVDLWVRHLAGCAQEMSLTSILVAPDGLAELPPLHPGKAGKWLDDIIRFWWQGLQQPLPVTAKTALAYVKILFSNDGEEALMKAQEAARKAYEGDGYNFQGELGYTDSVYLKRCYPDFDVLWRAEDNRFKTLAGQIYKPIMETIWND
ncbi:MAG: exodeoxyribonuclease V subunit gamma [Deltaproteobacteria bacterium]|nr:exodeoxyribonuclease V subunit gamma [Deltaproteobacteria bacterium]